MKIFKVDFIKRNANIPVIYTDLVKANDRQEVENVYKDYFWHDIEEATPGDIQEAENEGVIIREVK